MSANYEVRRIAEMTWREVATAVEEHPTMLLPLGATEQHGHHLPLGVDVFTPEAVAERVAAEVGSLLAPPVWYGVSPHHTFKPGTFTVSSETFKKYILDICLSAQEWGVETILLLNGHYVTQDPELDVAVRTLRNEHGLDAFRVALSDVWADAAAAERTGLKSFHAAEFETSVMLALRPDLVEMDEAVPVEVPDGPLPLMSYDLYGDNEVGWSLSADDMAELTPEGNLGDPTGATAEMGERMLEEAVTKLTTLVKSTEAD